jgi:branched-chain amino acid transport system substrate-binding protein
MENPEQYWNFLEFYPSEAEYAIQGWPQMMKLQYEYPNKKFFAIGEDDHWSHVIKDTYIEMAKKDGWEIVGNDTVSVATVEWGGILTKIRATNPAIIMMITLSPTAEAAFLTQFHKDPTNSLINMPYCPTAPEWRQLAGKYGDGVLWNTVGSIIPGAEADAFKERFVERFGPGTWNPGYAPGLWDLMHFWEEAVNAVGKVDDYRGIMNYFNTHSYKGYQGTYAFPKETNTAVSGDEYLPAPMLQIQSGEHVYLMPEKWAQGKFVVPGWIKE